MWHHDYLFWCGDFNYRIDLTKDEVIDLINSRNFAGLQAFDQLCAQRENGSVSGDCSSDCAHTNCILSDSGAIISERSK